MSDLVGQSIGRYHIIEKLGVGGMATVYKAFDTRLEREVAIKLIRRESVTPETLEHMLKRFEREAKSLARLSHPNIVKVHDFGEYDGSPYLVMEYIKGGTLKPQIGQPMPWQKAARLLAPVARSLAYAHRNNIIHRDVKPANILLTESGEPMLSDFGIAKILAAEDASHLTSTGMSIGTPEYMAPEQGTGHTVDARSDIYSLGVVFYELVTGQKPFRADTPMAVVIKHIHDPLPRPRNFVADLPEAVEQALFKAMAKRPEDRYETMDDFAGVLERLGWEKDIASSKAEKASITQPEQTYVPPATSPIPTPETQPIIPTPKTPVPVAPSAPRRTPWGWILGLGGLGLVLCAVLAFVILNSAGVLGGPKETGQGQSATATATMSSLVSSPGSPTAITNQEPSSTPDQPSDPILTPTEVPEITGNMTIRLWTEEIADSAGLAFIQDLCDQFTRDHPNVTFEVVGKEVATLREGFITTSFAGDPPDLLWTNCEFEETYAYPELFMPASRLSDDLSIYIENALQCPCPDGKCLGVPINKVGHLMLYYNKSLISQPPANTDELISMSQQIYTGDIYGLVFFNSAGYWMNPWWASFGADIFAEDGVTPSLDTPEMISTFRFMRTLTAEAVYMDHFDYGTADTLFQEGKAAMIINGEWALSLYQEILGDRLGVAPWPENSETGIRPTPYSSTTVFLAPASLEGARLEAVKAFISFATNEENQLSMFAILNRLPALKTAVFSPGIMDDPLYSNSALIMASSISIPCNSEMACIWSALEPNLQAIVEGSITPEQGAAGAQSSAETCISSLP